jgi:hypothetical protein
MAGQRNHQTLPGVYRISRCTRPVFAGLVLAMEAIVVPGMSKWLFLGLLLVLAVSCTRATTPAVGGPEPSPQGTPVARPAEGEAVIAGEAMVNSISLIGTNDPVVPYLLEIQGDLADGCTVVGEVQQQVVGSQLVVRVGTLRPADAICTQALVPYTHIIELDTASLPAGEYTVEVHGEQLHLMLAEDGSAATPGESSSGAAEDVLTRPATIDDINVTVTTARPARLVVTISGYFPDGCTSLGTVTQRIEGRRIIFNVGTVRPRDAMCTMALVPFTEDIPLQVEGLSAGRYTVEVNGLTEEIDLGAS